MEAEHVTLAEFVDASNHASCKGSDKTQFRRLLAQLERLPKTRERLVFEMLDAAWQWLEAKDDPLMLVVWVRAWSGAVEEVRLLDFLDKTERLIIRYFENLPQISSSEASLTLPTLFAALLQRCPARFHTVMERLKCETRLSVSDPRRQILADIETSL